MEHPDQKENRRRAERCRRGAGTGNQNLLQIYKKYRLRGAYLLIKRAFSRMYRRVCPSEEGRARRNIKKCSKIKAFRYSVMSGTTEKLNTRMKKGLQSAVLFSFKSFGNYRGKHIRILDGRGMSGKGECSFQF